MHGFHLIVQIKCLKNIPITAKFKFPITSLCGQCNGAIAVSYIFSNHVFNIAWNCFKTSTNYHEMVTKKSVYNFSNMQRYFYR